MKLLSTSTAAIAAATLAVMSLGACASATAATPMAEQSAGAGGDLAAYPAASADQNRHVIRLPARANEDDLKLELIVGKTQMVDCNIHRLGGSIEIRTAEGWGYDYFVVSDLGQGMSTLMGCADNSRKEAFVRGGGEPTLVRYNSRLPVVVYAPKDVEVRYRLWTAGAEHNAPR
jgi:ecotin